MLENDVVIRGYRQHGSDSIEYVYENGEIDFEIHKIDGNTYNNHYVNHKQHGEWVFKDYCDNMVYRGMFEHGKMVGEWKQYNQ